MKKELEKIYQNYFSFSHQECIDECNKKFSEITMQADFVKEITGIFADQLWENFESHGRDATSEEWNNGLQEIIKWLYE